GIRRDSRRLDAADNYRCSVDRRRGRGRFDRGLWRACGLVLVVNGLCVLEPFLNVDKFTRSCRPARVWPDKIRDGWCGAFAAHRKRQRQQLCHIFFAALAKVRVGIPYKIERTPQWIWAVSADRRQRSQRRQIAFGPCRQAIHVASRADLRAQLGQMEPEANTYRTEWDEYNA